MDLDVPIAILAALIVGAVIVGAAVAAVVAAALARRARAADPTTAVPNAAVVEELRRLAEEQRRTADDALTRLLETNRALLDQERSRTTSELDGRKSLIDRQLLAMTGELDKVGELVRSLDAERRTAYGELANELARQHAGIEALTEHTGQLREVLASQKVRGQWGERMADDVLRLAGFVEGINYRRNATLDGAAGRPDYTFMLPNDLLLHMDVKFPLDNYARFLDATTDIERKQRREQFLRDVRARVRELTGRGYLEAKDRTVDCLLMFIPNEQVYAFVQEHDREILDAALRAKIVICSPLTLYAVLAVVRQAVDNFRLERTTDEILVLLADFHGQWEKYVAQLEKVQLKFDQVAKEYGTLMTVRQRGLQRPLDKIEALRHDEPALVNVDISPLALDA